MKTRAQVRLFLPLTAAQVGTSAFAQTENRSG